jgi:hypothetical protein
VAILDEVENGGQLLNEEELVSTWKRVVAARESFKVFNTEFIISRSDAVGGMSKVSND